ncbi:MAG: ATP-binding cassette domain-containing protein [Pseudomonadota bacterium]
MTESASLSPERTPKIRIRDLHKRFGEKVVLDGLSLDLNQGDSLVVIGGSGTGKSVLLKCILGLLKPDSGTIEIDGEPAATSIHQDRDEDRANIGMLFQNAALFDSLSVWRNVAFGLMQGQGMKAKPAREIALAKLEQVGLGEDVAELFPDALSGGMRKRVGLARAIATEPEILFFDEPTTGLDPIMGHVIDDLIVSCVEKLGATALSITHDMASARRISNRMAMLYQGKLVWDGPTRAIDRSDNPVVDQFINGRSEGPITKPVKRA